MVLSMTTRSQHNPTSFTPRNETRKAPRNKGLQNVNSFMEERILAAIFNQGKGDRLGNYYRPKTDPKPKHLLSASM